MNIKVIIIGSLGCGKSTLIHRMKTGNYSSAICATVGMISEKIDLLGKSFQFYDMSGSDVFKQVIPILFHNAKIAIIAFSINSIETFQETDSWYEKIKDQLNVDDPNSINYVSLILVGTKSDLQSDRQISSEQGEEKANAFGESTKYIELSALNGENVNLLIDEIVNLSNKIPQEHANIKTMKDTHENGNGCC